MLTNFLLSFCELMKYRNFRANILFPDTLQITSQTTTKNYKFLLNVQTCDENSNIVLLFNANLFCKYISSSKEEREGSNTRLTFGKSW